MRCAAKCVAIGLWATGVWAGGATAGEPRPNFLFIAVDDLKPIIGAYSEEPGNFLQTLYPDPAKRAAIRKVLTPNLDRLAGEGVSFRLASCPSALCNPCRSSVLTGIRNHLTGIHDNSENFRQSAKPFVREAITLPQNLKQNGYYTAGTGKIFHHAAAAYGADGQITSDWPDVQHSWNVWINGAEGADPGRTILSPWSLPGGLFSFGANDGKTEAMDDYCKADLIARVLEKGAVTATDRKRQAAQTIDISGNQPFFLACGIFRPHLPWVAPQDVVDLFNPDDIQITREFYKAVADDLKDLPAGALKFTERPRDDGEPGNGRFSQLLRHGKTLDAQDGDLKAWREAVRHYLAAAAFADRCVGRLMQGLEKSAYKDNTVVVLWSDHGWMLGTKFRMHKAALWEEAANCVLIVKDPRQAGAQRGVACYRTVNLIDLYRTIDALAGAPTPSYVAGRDFSRLLAEPQAPWGSAALTTQGAGNHTVRTEQFRYMRYGEDPNDAELYDHGADPFEITNRINNVGLRPIRAQLNEFMDRILTEGPFPYQPAPRSGGGNRGRRGVGSESGGGE